MQRTKAHPIDVAGGTFRRALAGLMRSALVLSLALPRTTSGSAFGKGAANDAASSAAVADYLQAPTPESTALASTGTPTGETPAPATATPAATDLVEPVATDTVAAPTETGVLTETPSATVPAVSATPSASPTASATVAPTDLPPTLEPTSEPTIVPPAPLQLGQATTIYLPLVSGGAEQPVQASSEECTPDGGIVYLSTSAELARSRNFYDASPCWEDAAGNLPLSTADHLEGLTEFTLDPFNATNRAWVSFGVGWDGNNGQLWRTDDLNSLTPTWTEVLSNTELNSALGTVRANIKRVRASTVLPGFIVIAGIANTTGCGDCFRTFVGHSFDYGNPGTWQWSIAPAAERPGATGLELSSHDARRVWVAYPGGKVLASTDYGLTFPVTVTVDGAAFYPPGHILVPAEDNEDDAVIYVSVNGKIFRSTNGGGSYSDLGVSGPVPAYYNSVTAFAGDHQLMYYSSRSTPDCYDKSGTLYHSSDGGTMWSARSSSLRGLGGTWVSPTNPNRVYAAQGDASHSWESEVLARYSTDGGQTWTDKTGNWWDVYIYYTPEMGSCGGISTNMLIDAAQVRAVPPRSRRATLKQVKAGPSQTMPTDGREDGLSTYAGADCDCGDPINTLNGSFDYSTVDLSLPTVAGALAFQRSYASTATGVYTATLGSGWTHNLDTRLVTETTAAAGTLVWFKAHSANEYRFDVYTTTNGTAYQPYPGVLASLTYTAGTFLLTAPDQSTYTFNSQGRLTDWADALGHTWVYSYSASTGVLTQVTDLSSGRGLTLTYDVAAPQRLVTVQDHAGRQVDFDYTGEELTSVTDVLGQTWTYTYTTAGAHSHLLAEVIDPRGVTVVQTDYDTSGRAWRQYDGEHVTPIVQVSYGLDGSTVITDGRGATTTHSYLGNNTLAAQSAPLDREFQQTFDASFRPATVQDPLGQPVSMTWSSTGANLTGVTDALSQSVQLSYDGLNNLTETVDARQVSTTYGYTGTLLTTLTQAGTSTSLYTYTTAADNVPVGLLKAASDPAGRIMQYQYDSLGQLETLTDTAGLVTTYGYDTLGRVLTTTLLAGTAQAQVTVNAYDAAGRLLQVTRNATAASAQQNYPADDAIYNQITRYEYDEVGNQVALTDTLDLVTRTEYDAANRPVAITVTTSAGQVQDLTRMLYDIHGNVISTTLHAHAPALAQTTVTGYDALNRPVTVTANYVNGVFDTNLPDEDLTTVTEYDPAGNVVTVTELHGTALARTSATAYDPLHRPISVTVNVDAAVGPDRNLTTLTDYDENGNVISTTTHAEVPSLALTTLTEYDALNRPVTVTTAAGTALALTIVTAYNAAGQVISTTEAFGTSQARTTLTEYDEAGRPVTVTANYVPGGPVSAEVNLVQVTQYDALGRRGALLERRVSPAGTSWITTTFGYNNLGQLLTTTVPLTSGLLATTSQRYDALGRVITQTDTLGRPTVTAYDALGRPVTVTVNYVNGVFDPNFPDEDLVTVTSYDAAGQRVLVTDPTGRQTRFGYDLAGRLAQVVENDGQFGGQAPVTTTYSYDGAGNLLALTDGRGMVSTFTYDRLNRQLTATDPLTHTTVYTYNAAGHQTALLDANGQVTDYTYDRLGRLTAIDYPGATADVAFDYDLLGQRTVMTDGTGTTTWAYDLASRPLTITQAGLGAPVVYGYDSAGQRTNLTYPDGQVVTYTYDLGLRLVTATDWQSAVTHYSYNAAGQVLTTSLPNGVTSGYGYDDAHRLTNIQHGSGAGVLSGFDYQLDAAGNRTQVEEQTGGSGASLSLDAFGTVGSASLSANGTVGIVTSFAGGSARRRFAAAAAALGSPASTAGATVIDYTYDAQYRLTRADYADGSYFDYSYDEVGNRTQEVSCWGGSSCTPITTTYTYDDANRLATVGGQAYDWDANGNLLHDGVFTYTYDAANRLIAATTGLTTTTFSYRCNGLSRDARGAIGCDSDLVSKTVNGVTTHYVLDLAGGMTQVLAETTGGQTTTYLYGNGRIAQYGGSDFEYFLGDALGSVRQLADATADVTLARSYEPYGDVLSSVGTGTTNYDFTGEWRDSAVGLLYLRARWLKTTTGTFQSKDNWRDYGRPLSLNGWVYVEGNPINSVDPTGRSPTLRSCYNTQAQDNLRYCILNRGGFLDVKHFNGGMNYGNRNNPGSIWQQVYANRNNSGVWEYYHLQWLITPVTGWQAYSVERWYSVGHLDELSHSELEGVAISIYMNSQVLFESASLSFANEDFPSDYLGFVAGIREKDLEWVVKELGGGYASRDFL